MSMEYSNHARHGHRISRSSSRPTLSIVLASVESRTIAESCITALVARCENAEAELIVVRPGGAPLGGGSARYRSRVRFVTAPADCSTQELRSQGMLAARGDIVLMLEDTPGVELHAIERILGMPRQRNGAADQAMETISHPSDSHRSPVRAQEPRDSALAFGELGSP